MHRWAKSVSLALMCAVVALIACQLARAQESSNTKATVEELYIPQISPASGNPDHEWEDIGPAMELGDALKKTAAWHSKFPDSLRLTREFKVERRNVPRAPRQEKTDDELPNLISKVRPGSPEFSKNKKADDVAVKPLSGKTGTGTIGADKVSIEFNGKGEKGTFTVTGGMKGKGEWKQLGKFVMMETDWSKYQGTIDGDSVKGTRIVKTTGEKDTWSVRLAATPLKSTIFHVEHRYRAEGESFPAGYASSILRLYAGDEEVILKTDNLSLSAARQVIEQKKRDNQILRQMSPDARHQYYEFRIVDEHGRVIE